MRINMKIQRPVGAQAQGGVQRNVSIDTDPVMRDIPGFQFADKRCAIALQLIRRRHAQMHEMVPEITVHGAHAQVAVLVENLMKIAVGIRFVEIARSRLVWRDVEYG